MTDIYAAFETCPRHGFYVKDHGCAKCRAWVGFDLDATTARYVYGSYHADEIGEPIPETIARIRRILAKGYKVKIYTARMCEKDPVIKAQIAAKIAAWTLEHVGTALEATNEKDYDMIEVYDDRAVGVEPNTGRLLNASSRGFD